MLSRSLDLANAALTRADFLRASAAAVVAATVPGTTALAHGAEQSDQSAIETRLIPSSKSPLPVIGVGTWQGFDVGASTAERAPLAQVLGVLLAGGGTVIDCSPMYGRAEAVTGDLLGQSAHRDKAFVATKVWTRGRAEGIAQMERSMALLKTPNIDLMQVHNLVDYAVHLETLRGWQAEGRVKYIGVTHYTSSAYRELEAVLRQEKLDFVQFNYAMDDRDAEKTLLPLAADRGMAVLINRPFGGGGLLRTLKDRPLPAWASEIACTSWAQVLLKFIISHPAVTCAIPGTAKPEHMADNMNAGRGPMPDAAMREKMAASIAS